MRAAATLALSLLAVAARAESTTAPALPRAELRVPSGARSLALRALRLEEEGRLAEALTAYTEAISLDGTDGLSILALARLRLRLGDLAEAERLLAAALRFPDSASGAHAERGRLREAQGRTSDAITDYEHALALAPEERAVAAALVRLHVQARAWLPALAVQRRLHAETRDPMVLQEAKLSIQALALLAGPLDPVHRGPAAAQTFTRRALSRIAP